MSIELRVFSHMHPDQIYTAEGIAWALGISSSHTRAILRRLKDCGAVTRSGRKTLIGRGRGFYWQVNQGTFVL